MLTVRTSENTVITSFRLISERQDFSSVRTGENTVRARARIQIRCSMKIFNKNIVKILAQENVLFTIKAMSLSSTEKTAKTVFGNVG